MARIPPARILVAADFGDASATAVWVAGSLASAFSAELVVIHAESIEAPIYFTHEQIERLEQERLAARRAAQRYTLDFAARQTRTPVSLVEIVDGPPAEAILKQVPASDLTVLGTHGYRGARRWWLGSVAEHVVRESPVPVLVVHALAEPDATWTPALITILGDTPGARVQAWTNALSSWARAPVTRVSSIAQCGREAVARTSLVVVPLSPGLEPPAVGDLGRVLTGCLAPVLFVPDTGSISERTSTS